VCLKHLVVGMHYADEDEDEEERGAYKNCISW
jgi:hypothetical protein